jgi:hypothetical protein
MNTGSLIHDLVRISAHRREQSMVRILHRSRSGSRRGQLLVLGVMPLLISALVATTLIHLATTDAAERQPTINPGLILRPQTASQSVASGNVHARLQAAPLIPGTNHFTLNLDDHGRPIGDARITLTATMPGMQMHPIHYPAYKRSAGVYTARGPVTMFGRWRFDLRIQRPHSAPVNTSFMLFFNVPLAAMSRADS